MAVTAPANGTQHRDVIERLQDELDTYLREMQTWHGMDPDQVLIRLSALGARAIELKVRLVRNETRMAQAFRTRQLEPFIDQLDYQFKVHSRLQATREFELKMAGGAPA